MESNDLPTVNAPDAMPGRIEQAIAELRTEVARGFAHVDGRLARVDERLGVIDERQAGVVGRLDGVDGRLDAMDGQLASVRQEIRAGDEQTRAEMRVLIESVRDDVRIFAEAHVALERRPR